MKKGFTLAEMLMVIGIIGVVTMILLPILLNAMPNQEMLMFRKAYYLAERSVAEMINDEDLYRDEDDDGSSLGLDDTASVRYKGNDHVGDTKFCTLFASKINKSTDVDCTAKIFTDGTAPSGTFSSADNIVWILPITTFADADTGYEIKMDVNATKAPNCEYNATTCAKPDRFTIKVYQDGRVLVDGVMEREYLRRSKITKDAPMEFENAGAGPGDDE